MASSSSHAKLAVPTTPEQASDSEQAELAGLQLELRSHKERMFKQGLFDDHFTQLELLETPERPGFVADAISAFCGDAEMIFGIVDNSLAAEGTNFPLLSDHFHNLKAASRCIGCPTIVRVCNNFTALPGKCNKKRCIEALHAVKSEFYRMKANLKYIVAIHDLINSYEEAKAKSSSGSPGPSDQ